MIRYYSASREETVWAKATDAALIVTLVLAFPAAWIADTVIIRDEPSFSLTGRLWELDDATLSATFDHYENPRASHRIGKPIGNFQMDGDIQYRGWPLNSSIKQHPIRLDYDILSETKPQENAQLSDDSPLRIAIANCLRNDERTAILEWWNNPDDDLHRRWITMGANAVVWWIVLAFAASFVIQLLRFCALLIRRHILKREYRRRSSNKCVNCGYDLTGLDFRDRCPECGKLIW